VVIGLGWDLDAVTLTASGRFEVVGAGPRSGGAWSVFLDDGTVVLFPSVGYPISPEPGRDVAPV
jgi:hypothetical protein